MRPVKEVCLQRLFSTFADGWPGVALLLQRLLIAAALVQSGVTHLKEMAHFTSLVPHLIGAVAGILLFLGLWTPLAGALAAAVEVWIALSHAGDPWVGTVLAILAATLAMIGPGAWSIDARLFGRKHMEIPDR